jgi:hypothetical protein
VLPVSRECDTLIVRIAAALLLACIALFLALSAAAMALYPGGTWWDPTTHGARFWQNFLCDLEWNPALNGAPNPVGSRLAQAAMLVMIAGFVPFWWIAPRLFPARRALGMAERALGLTSVAGMIAVVLMPSDRFGALHGVAVVVAALPGLSAALLAIAGMLRGDTAGARAAGAVGGAMLAVAIADFALYVDTILHGGPGSRAIPAAQKVALLLLLAWMTLVAARVRSLGATRTLVDGREPR